MYKVNTWFANQIAKLAGFFGDKSIIYEMKASEADVIEAANRFGFCYFDCGSNFVLARPKYCK